ncbi:MAG TPA: hypothetical protein VGD91_11355 [Trebonia sp.]
MTPGMPAEQKGPVTAWCDDTCLNQYFTTPGAPAACDPVTRSLADSPAVGYGDQ